MRKWGMFFLLLLLISSSIGIGYGIWFRSARNAEQPMASGPLAHLPDYVQKTTSAAQMAYQFAIDHPEILKQIPCYCGCEKTLGHKHNLACYVTTFKPDGSVAQYSDHAVYCTTCLDITQIAMKMRSEGKTVQAIHNTIDTQYGHTEPHTHDQESTQ